MSHTFHHQFKRRQILQYGATSVTALWLGSALAQQQRVVIAWDGDNRDAADHDPVPAVGRSAVAEDMVRLLRPIERGVTGPRHRLVASCGFLEAPEQVQFPQFEGNRFVRREVLRDEPFITRLP